VLLGAGGRRVETRVVMDAVQRAGDQNRDRPSRSRNRLPGLPETTDVERHRLLEAVRDGNADRAAEIMRAHIDSVRAAVVSELARDA
jgi:DNA-binding GntR family transcriptional regulator